VLLRDERTLEGARMRRLVDLELVRSRTPMFAVTWMVMHPIDSRSPLHGLDQAAFRALNAEVICSITGLDDTSMQTVHARHVYATHDVRWNSRLVDILGDTGDGRWSIDYSRFDDIVDEPTAAGRSALPETHG
jgi:inward rectifier potassium channel